jgi:hypothetical protein
MLVAPFINLFDQLFVWKPDDCVVEFVVEEQLECVSYAKKYRFTLQESDTADLKEQIEDYPSGAGISHPADGHFEWSG